MNSLTVDAIAIMIVKTKTHSSKRLAKCFGLLLGFEVINDRAMLTSMSKTLISLSSRVLYGVGTSG